MISNSRILITGSSGQLGQEFLAYFKTKNYVVKGLNRKEADFSDDSLTNLESLILSFKPDYLINCAAYTAVDQAEDEIELAKMINCGALLSISKLAEKFDFKILHFSTDYVFDGTASAAYSESNSTNPLNVYGESKRDGEEVLSKSANSLTLRVSWLYSEFGSNFPKTINRLLSEKEELNVVNDQVSSPTWTKPLVRFVDEKLLCNAKLFNGSLYNYSEDGEGSWYNIAQVINEFHGKKLTPVSSDQFPQVAQRPSYSKLNNSLAKNVLKLETNSWQDNLRTFLKLIQ